MPRLRPACEIEPPRPISSSRRILPGPIDRLEPKSTRKVSLVLFTAASVCRKRRRYDTTAGGAAKAHAGSLLRAISIDTDHHVAGLDHRVGDLSGRYCLCTSAAAVQ